VIDVQVERPLGPVSLIFQEVELIRYFGKLPTVLARYFFLGIFG
jgi:hypothetical protein